MLTCVRQTWRTPGSEVSCAIPHHRSSPQCSARIYYAFQYSFLCKLAHTRRGSFARVLRIYIYIYAYDKKGNPIYVGVCCWSARVCVWVVFWAMALYANNMRARNSTCGALSMLNTLLSVIYMLAYGCGWCECLSVCGLLKCVCWSGMYPKNCVLAEMSRSKSANKAMLKHDKFSCAYADALIMCRVRRAWVSL